MALSGSSTVTIESPIEVCMQAGSDFERASEWQQSIKSGTVLERDDSGRAILVEAVFDALASSARMQMQITYARDGNTARRASGDLKNVEATWSFEALGADRTRATYTLNLDPGRVLGVLMKGPAAGQLRKLLIDQPSQGLKTYVEAG